MQAQVPSYGILQTAFKRITLVFGCSGVKVILDIL